MIILKLDITKMKNMAQHRNNFICGIKKQHWIKVLALLAILSFIVYMKFTLYEPLGRNDFQIISLESKNNMDSEESKIKSEMSNLGQIESSILTMSYDDVQNETSNENNDDEIDNDTSNIEYIDVPILDIDYEEMQNKTFDEISNDDADDISKLEHIDSSTVTMNYNSIQNETSDGINHDEVNSVTVNLESIEVSTPVVEIGSKEESDHSDDTLKYILQWTSGKKSPFYHMGNGQDHFFKFNCTYTNCFVTDNKTLLPHLTDFDAIVFNGNYVIQMDQSQLPQERSPKQKYIFGGTEPAAMKLACRPVLDNFFNWTWTYRLDSDFRWGYITVFDLDGKAVGPKEKMEWPEEMEPIDSETQKILDGKTKAAAWFVSRCKSPSRREDVVKKVATELEEFGLSVDVYGRCGNFTCPRSNSEKCFDLVKTDYYFYFSFENSFSVDYVTEKLLTALQNYAVPVVYGRADYSRFLPPGSYLDARVLSPKELAETMRDLINDKERYYDFFRWRNHFKYKETTNCDDVCNVCNALNDKQRVNTICTHENFRKWWNDEWHSSCKS